MQSIAGNVHLARMKIPQSKEVISSNFAAGINLGVTSKLVV